MNATPLPAVSVALRRGDRLLLVRRGRPPAFGLYAFPGGRVEAGETLAEAAQRELREETGLEAEDFSPFRTYDLPGEGAGPAFALTVFRAEWHRGEPVAADDAAEAAFFSLGEMDALPVIPSVLECAFAILGDAD